MPGISGIKQLNIALDVIEAAPETWNQSEWARGTEESCGTAYCLAGHLCVLDGAVPDEPLSKPYWQDAGYESLGSYMDAYLDAEWNTSTPQELLEAALEMQTVSVSELRWPDGSMRDIEGEARRILGINEETAGRLFSGSNSFNDLKDMRDRLTERESLWPVANAACTCSSCEDI